MDNKIYYKNETIVCKYPLLPKSFYAITIFGKIYTPCTKKEIQDSLNSWFEFSAAKVMVNHEKFHIDQGRQLGWLIFYILYGWYWVIGCFKYGFKNSYENIPFEKEAYTNEKNMSYWNNENAKSNWRNYK